MSVPIASPSRVSARSRTPGYERAAADHGLSLARSFVVGDSPDDMRAARRLGAKGCLVKTGWAADPRVVEAAAPDASVIAGSLEEAVNWILGGGRGELP